HAALLTLPLTGLLLWPGDPLSPEAGAVGNVWGWLALLLALAAGFWYVVVAARHAAVHLLGSAGLAVGVLAACTINRWDAGDWLSYHLLVAAWTLAAALPLAAWRPAPRLPPMVDVPAAAAAPRGGAAPRL